MTIADQIRQIRRVARIAERAAVKPIPILTGDFVPTLVGSGTAGTFTYTANSTIVEWTRIGNRLFFNGRILITAIAVAPTLNMTINGFPYTAVADSNMAIAGGGQFSLWQFNVAAGYTHVAGTFLNTLSTMAITKNGDNLASANVQGSEVALINAGGTTIDLRFSGQYRVA